MSERIKPIVDGRSLQSPSLQTFDCHLTVVKVTMTAREKSVTIPD